MKLGAFSISLSVKDIRASEAFYNKLGFSTLGGDISQNWLILRNGDTVIGLFQGMFSGNLLTFNPGWDQSAQNLDSFTDIRELRLLMEKQGLGPAALDNDTESGPASFTVTDPDGNMILFDQHR
ncbi:MAG: VOC family protein [Candidatus Cloacimonetes bacterium]|nr:VOC family protein [Candidatus Cloacimonadota bacterium]